MCRPGVAYIRYLENPQSDRIREWTVGCLVGKDSSDSVRQHLQRHRPGAILVSVRFVADNPIKKEE